MVDRTILIHGEAKKNKNYRKKYFVLNIGPDYSSPRLDYFSNVDKWTKFKNDLNVHSSEGVSFRSIDLSNLFSVDDVHRSKPKHGGLDLYMEDRYVTLVFLSDEVKKRWKEFFENIIYKNGKLKSYPTTEHTLQVAVRLKSKESIDESILLQWKGDFRVCFMKTSLMFVNKSINNPKFTIQYPFIRQWESRYDGTFRLEIGRAAFIGECFLILQLIDFSESKAAHSMLTNCIKYFKMTRPELPKPRSISDKFSNRRRSSKGKINSTSIPMKSESCIGFSKDSFSFLGVRPTYTGTGEPLLEENDSNYMTMNMCGRDTCDESINVRNYVEHISRIYKCSACGNFTKVITFCSRCISSSSLNNLQMICKIEGFKNSVKTKLFPSIRDKAQSFTERPIIQSLFLGTSRQDEFFSETEKSNISQKSQSFSKTSTNEVSLDSNESQNSLSISANRHDDEIFMELDFDHFQPLVTSVSSSKNRQNISELKCCNCSSNLSQRSSTEICSSQKCSKCFDEMFSLSVLIERIDGYFGCWIPNTTCISPNNRTHVTCYSEYVEENCEDNNLDSFYLNSYCS